MAITRQILGLIRASDTICRWGGEEFVILLPGCDLDQAQSMAERIRQKVAAGPIEGTPVTIPATPASLGVAQYPGGHARNPAVPGRPGHVPDQEPGAKPVETAE